MPLESCLGAVAVACMRQGIMQLYVVVIEEARRQGRGVVMQTAVSQARVACLLRARVGRDDI